MTKTVDPAVADAMAKVKGSCGCDMNIAVSQMHTLTFAHAKPAAFSFKDGAGLLTTDGQVRATWDMMMRQLDK